MNRHRHVDTIGDRIGREHWNANARAWTTRVGGGQDQSREFVINPAMRSVLEQYGGARVLDVGSGPGSVLNLLSPEPARLVVACDSSQVMASLAAQSMPTVCCDAIQLPFASASFDTVIQCLVLQGVRDLSDAVLEAARVIQPGGHVITVLVHPARVMPIEPSGGSASALGDVRDYLDQRQMVARIKVGGPSWLPTTVPYFHRTLSVYFQVFAAAGFSLVNLSELTPVDGAHNVASDEMIQFWNRAPFLLLIWQREISTSSSSSSSSSSPLSSGK